LGRPDQAAVVFGRRVTRQTPGRFHTKIFNRGVEAAIQIHYRASKVKQYDRLPAAGLRFGEPRTMVLLACLCSCQADPSHPAL
jgi:hypothetical protein